MMRLSREALPDFQCKIQKPNYLPGELTPGIVHIGVGNFHRAHQAIYLDDLFLKGLDRDWAIIGAGVRPGDARMRDILGQQDFLSTIVELDPTGPRARIVGAMTDFLAVETHNTALVDAMARPETRIVSMTVTEGGYYIDTGTNSFDMNHKDIVADARQLSAPQTVFGAIVAALLRRKAAGDLPFTVMSCDNIPGNGQAARQAVTGLAAMADRDLARWIEDNVAFPNAMVDRITPATGAGEIALVRDVFQYDDPVPVTCEPFRQWVLEDQFSAGRPRLEDVGVTFTANVHTYENMKIRMLNGGHAVMAYAAALLDIEFAHQAMADPFIHAYFLKVEKEEILPYIAPVPDMSPAAYLKLIDQRFANPMIKDTTRRLCFDGSNRQPKFILPSIVDGRQQDRSVSGLALVSALWCRYCAGTTETGLEIAPNDPEWERRTRLANMARSEPLIWLGQRDVYGDLADDAEFGRPFAGWLQAIWRDGVRNTLDTYLNAAG